MATTPGTYSSAHMRERDKIIEEKYQKELYALQRKIDNIRWTHDDNLKQLYDMQARTLRLANSLGFKNVGEAQVYIDTADHEIPYKECFEEVVTLKAQLETSHSQDVCLRERLEVVEKENVELRAMLRKQEKEASERGSGALELQLSELQKLFDDLRDTYERAGEKYKSDYRKWMAFNAWLFSDDTGGDVVGASGKKRPRVNLMRKKRLVKDVARNTGVGTINAGDVKEEDCPPPLGGIANPFLADKENQSTPASNGDTPQQKNFVSSLLSKPRPTAITNSTRTLVKTLTIVPSSSPSMFLCPSSTATVRGAIGFKPVPSSVLQPKQQLESTPSKAEKRRDSPDNIFNSSDTEEDTQAPAPREQVFKVPDIPTFGSSETEEDTQPSSLHEYTVSLPTPKSRPRPSTFKYGNTTQVDDSMEPPRKIRRIEAVGVPSTPKSPRRQSFRRTASNSSNTPANVSFSQQWRSSDSKCSSKKAKDKGVDKENQNISTPASDNAQGRATPQDYSAFKGRGRYAKEVNSTKTINSKFEIDPSRNDGLKCQYDEVVRRKEDRRKMDAGDCECCHDYYEAVGPLPARLQPPLWRSPSRTEVKKKVTNCAGPKRHASDPRGPIIGDLPGATATSGKTTDYDDFEDESQFGISDGRHRQIEDHKKSISRHRHQWARGNTPPGYWDIGFPSTQEAAEINEKAKEIHRKKQAEIERTVSRGEGKYRKRS